MKKNWIALLLALCMLITLGTASACCADACCTDPSGMDEARTMEETCPCMMDGKGVNGCPCMGDACGEDCTCMDGAPCMQDGMCADGCMCEKQCACGDACVCGYEEKLEMLEAELNDVFEANMDLWDHFFSMMDKQPDMDMSYADYLTEQLEMMKEKFTEEEYKLLQQDIETIRRLDEEIDKLEEMLMQNEGMAADSDMAMESDMVTADGGMVVGNEGTAMADDNMTMTDKDTMTEDDSSMKFPEFEGMDLDGNPVTSELFKENSVTVVNFWFSTCAPCIAELGELNELNEKLQLRGGEVIGINADTIGGDEEMIMEAKELLKAKGAMYRNLYFPENSEVGQLAYSIMAFPTTVVVDRNGNVVGEPILGGINNEAQMKALQTIIDEVLARDVAMLDKDMMMKPDGM